MTDSKRKLHSVLEDGTEIFEYPDGALRKHGAYYKRPPQAAEPFNTDTAIVANLAKSAIRDARVETLQGEARRLLTKQAKTATAEQAGAILVEDIYKTARHKETKPRDKVACADFVLKHAGMQAKEQASGPAITLQMTPEAIDRMYALSMGVPADVVEGVVVPDAIRDDEAEADSG